jgi:hypothetical protein
MSMENTSDIIGNRTRDLSDCSSVSQPTAPQAACPEESEGNFERVEGVM